jgi:SAM-dependent methyltransferase
MHDTAMLNCRLFFDCYSEFIAHQSSRPRVVEIGSQDVNGSIRTACPVDFEYIGVDFVEGKGVDVVLEDPYQLPFESESVDVVVSSSCMEHSEMFWVLFLEILRIVKPHGLIYLNVPSNGSFHRYPVDCWRFYPDSGRALVTWARRNGINAALLESYTSKQVADEWNDFVAVFLKDEQLASEFPRRILDRNPEVTNALRLNGAEPENPCGLPEDKVKLILISKIIANQIKLPRIKG